MKRRESYVLPVLVIAVLLTSGTALTAQSAIPAPPDLAEPPADAESHPSGLVSKVLVAGSGAEQPDDTSQVIVHYTVWTSDGKMFDSSVARSKKASLALDVMIDGFVEGVKLMVAGEKRRLWIPAELAYAGVPDKPQGNLVFDVELFDFVRTRLDDIAEPPDGAESVKSGLTWVVLREGTGTRHPKRSSRVTVHYSGWTLDGKMFDSSITRGQPTTFGLNQVIRGWTEGVRLMVEGEKRRFWIPAKMAYKGVRDRPQGTLVFDIELLSIE